MRKSWEWRTVAIKLETGLDLAHNSTLRAEVANLLRKQILDGEIPSGTRLIETEIASQLGVSRMPVREALRMLESEGLINSVPRKGLIVAEYTEEDIREYYTIREALEVCAIKIVIDKITKDEIHELECYCRRAEDARLAGDRDEVCKWTGRFNDRLYDCCGMPRLKEQIKNTHKYLRTFRFTSFKEPSRTAQALREHEEILRLVAEKDYEGAARATSVHLRDSMEMYLKLWRQRKDPQN
ncbi:hypothetical protein B5F39_09865 [Cloacibacillus sp. An23]|nr:hypothetical protein B5F39_09865 [Cloacibacillus sp. An23]